MIATRLSRALLPDLALRLHYGTSASDLWISPRPLFSGCQKLENSYDASRARARNCINAMTVDWSWFPEWQLERLEHPLSS